MAEQFYTILTKVGKAKIANATALGTKVNFCKFQVGDSNGTYYNPTEEQTELRHKVWEGNINNIRIDEENPNWIIIEVLLPSNVGGFMIREAAILDDEDNVVAIAKYPETYKPQTQDGSSKDILIRTILEVSNTSSVILKVDPTVILATKKDIEVLENKIRDLKGVYAEDLLDETVIIEGEMHPIIKEEFEKVESQMAEMTKEIENIDLSANKVKLNKISGMNATEVQTAIQELFQFADNGKKNISSVIGSPLTSSDTFDSMKSKIQTLKNTFASNLTAKGQSSSGSDTLNNLINKIVNINTGKKFAKGTVGSNQTINLSFKPSYIILSQTVEIDEYNNEKFTMLIYGFTRYTIYLSGNISRGAGGGTVMGDSYRLKVFENGFSTESAGNGHSYLALE